MREEEVKKPEKKDLAALEDQGPRGRGHGKHKDVDAQLAEDKAKGHLGKPQGEMPGEATSEEEDLHGDERAKRGPQHGFGKNQGKEFPDKSTPFGTRAPGGHHG